MSWRVAFLLLCLCAPTALAHAEPVEASPGWNERLADAPTEVVVAFSEPVFAEGSWIRVRNLDGERVDNDDLSITGGNRPVMRLSLPPLEDGAYLIRWQTYSQTDGHTIGGAIGFSIGAFAPPESGADETIRLGAIAARTLTYLGYVLALGAMAFHWGVLRQPVTQRAPIMDAGLIAGAALNVAGIGWLLLDTAAGTGLGLSAFLAGVGGRELLIRWFVALGLLGLSGLWLRGPVQPKSAPVLLAGLWLLLIALGSKLGHAMGPAAQVVQVLHAIAIASWLGGLAFMVRNLWVAPDDRVLAVGRRFGTLGLVATVLMAVTGLYLAAVVVGSALMEPGQAFANAWRASLSGKILLSLAMIGLACLNRWVILGDSTSGQSLRKRWFGNRGRGMKRLAGVEVAVGVVVMVLAGVLMSSAAPTAGLESKQASFEAAATGFDFESVLVIDPEPREAEFHLVRLYLEDFAGEPLRENSCAEGRTDCVSLEWYADAEGEETAQASVGVPEGDGWWTFENLLFAQAGNHTMVAEASSAYAFKDELVFHFTVLRSIK